MMTALLEGAVNWVRAGLPMKRMKIVIYTRNPSKDRSSYNGDVAKLFEAFKSRIEKSQNKKRREKEVNAKTLYTKGWFNSCLML